MHFDQTLRQGKLIKRYKRFLADIELSSDNSTTSDPSNNIGNDITNDTCDSHKITSPRIVTAHCPNPGSMLGLADPGTTVYLSKTSNPKRKLQYTWELSEINNRLVGINTGHPNKIAREAIKHNLIPALADYNRLRSEVAYGTNSRIDILLEDDSRKPCYVEVKNVHLMRQNGLAEFPDSVTKRGSKHLQELSKITADGARAVMLFIVQRMDADVFTIASDIDPYYLRQMQLAIAAGVEIEVWDCQISLSDINLKHRLKFKLPQQDKS